MGTLSAPLQAYRRGWRFDGGDFGVLLSPVGTDHVISAGNYCYAAFLVRIPSLSTGTETIMFAECGDSASGWGCGYANNGGSGKLWWGCRSGSGIGRAFATDWTSDGALHLIEFVYSWNGTTHSEEIYIDGVLQSIDFTETDGTIPGTAIALGTTCNLFDTFGSMLANQFGSDIRGSTAYGNSSHLNLMPNGGEAFYVRIERQTAGVADFEWWADDTASVGTDEAGNYTLAWEATVASEEPTSIAAEFTVTAGASTLTDSSEQDLGTLANGATVTLTVENTGDAPGWIENGTDEGGNLGATTEPSWPVLLEPAATTTVTMTVAGDGGTGGYTFDAFQGDWLNEFGLDGNFFADLAYASGGGGNRSPSQAPLYPMVNRRFVMRRRRREEDRRP